MEINVKTLGEQTFHEMHALPFGALPDLGDTPGEGVLRMRFDGFVDRDEPRIFAIFPVSDLEAISDRFRLPEPPGVGLPGSDVFFMRGPDGLALYVDTDRQERLWIEILDEACDAGLEVVQADCDLAMICQRHLPFDGLSGDVSPPRNPAFDAGGFEHVPIEVGAELLRSKRSMEMCRDDPSIPGF